MNEVIEERLAKFDEEIKAGPVNMAEHMMDMAFSIIMRSIFSISVPEEQVQKMSGQITQIQAFVIQLIRQPYLNWWRALSGKIKEHEAIAADLEDAIRKLVHQRQDSGETRDDLLQMLLDSRYEDTGEAMNEQQLLDELKIIFVAGHETSANGLAWAWYLLSQHPEALTKIREELQQVVGERTVAFEDLPKLEYLSQVVDEILRLYPPAWITDRMAVEADEFNGIKIAKGAIVATYIYGAHHSPEHWENPEAFRPERFAKNAKIPAFAYLPFGGGPRLCIGNHFALMEMQLVIAEMARRYDFALEPGHEVVPQPLITLRPKDGVWMRFWKRKDK
jgi:cytochrome P450